MSARTHPRPNTLKHTKKTLITTETSEMLIFRWPTSRQRAWCEACGAESEMVSPEVAARDAGLSVREIFRLIETGQVHFIESLGGSSLVCLKSFGKVRKLEDEENV